MSDSLGDAGSTSPLAGTDPASIEITLNWLQEALDAYEDTNEWFAASNNGHPAFWTNAARRWLEQQRAALKARATSQESIPKGY